jgi:ribosomal protein S18 acetylase RimI-like enzyme
VFTWLASAANAILTNLRFLAKGSAELAIATVGAVNVPASNAEQSNRNFRLVGTRTGNSYFLCAGSQAVSKFVLRFASTCPGAPQKIPGGLCRMISDPVFFATRPETPADQPFLLELYASTRQEELDALDWSGAARKTFLEIQFKAQQQGYRAAFPLAEFSITLLGNTPIGHIVVNRSENDIRLVDIAVLPGHRGLGAGTTLIGNLLREAAAAGKPVRLSVLKGQRALTLYHRLGFRKVKDDGVRDQMEWRADRIY